jgi:hypothetical protein
MFDENHIQTCDACCTHSEGWWKLEKRYGSDNGKYACKRGCGTIADKPTLAQSMTRRMPKPRSEEDLMELTKEALADVLGREPTKQEILRAHAGFKRMAFMMYEHLQHQERQNTTPQDEQNS